MHQPPRRHRNPSPASLRRAALAPINAFEPLEPRVLLSGDAPYETISWYGSDVQVRAGSWVVSFDQPLQNQDIEWSLFKAMQEVGLERAMTAVEPIGRGLYARLALDKPLSESKAYHLAVSTPGISAISPDFVYRPAATLPNDPLFTDQYHLLNTGQPIVGVFGTAGADIKATDAWDTSTGSKSVIVGVIDTGVDLQHPDLAPNIWTNPGEVPGNGLDDDGNGFIDDVSGWDFGELDNDPDDVEGHGTSVAGLIGAVGNNGIGVAGVAWNVSIIPLKVADQFGGLSVSAIVGAHDYLTMMIQRGHNIVASNNSYAGFNSTFYENAPMGFSAERDAIVRFITAGGTFVASAGNNAFDLDNPNFTAFPASYNIPGLISVAASDNNDALASFSNFGTKRVDLAAPGVNTLTTSNGGSYQFFSGTSASAPVVTGAVAILKSAFPDASPVEIRQALINGADPKPTLQGKMVSGGRLNLLRSLQVMGIEGPVVRSISPGPNASAPATSISVTFSEPLDPAFVSLSAVSLTRSATSVSLASISTSSGNTVVTITPTSPLTSGSYTLTLDPSGFRDTDGNLLNGNLAAGLPEVYSFNLAAAGSKFETNDSISSATPVAFSANGTARFTSLAIGDGGFGNLDVDFFRIDMPRGGVITADVDARSLPAPSSLDSYLRLFNADGTELAANDQFDGADSFINYFVTSGGSYYVAVSGYPNRSYDPFTPGSGVTQSKGTYNLNLSIELVNDDLLTKAASIPTPLAIPDGSSSVSSSITITDARLVLDANVNVAINHAFTGDLRVTLVSPAGTEITLMNRRGGAGSFQFSSSPPFFPARFDDEASTPIASAPTPYAGGSFKPDQPLSTIDGQSALGTWTLRVEDLDPINAGTLVSWSLELTLQNDIFGPFEFNDTLTTAGQLSEIAGVGSATRQAVIGDGGFGFKDVDIYTFTANAGSTLEASVTSDGTLDTALRLFNATGTEVKFNNPDSELNAQIARFVLVDPGIYYIAVTEAANTAFDPFAGGSGSDAATTGSYTLSVNVTDGVSDGAVTLAGDNLSLSLTPFGTLDPDALGITYQGVPFLANPQPTNAPSHYFSLIADGNSFRNDLDDNDPDLPMSVLVQSDHANRRALVEGVFRGIHVQRAISFAREDSFFVVDVTLTNNTPSALANVAWMEVLNPDQGRALVPASPNTSTDITAGAPLVQASYATTLFPDGLTIALAAPAADSRAFVTTAPATDTTIRDPQRLLDMGVIDPDGASADHQIGLAFSLGALSPAQSVSMRYFVFLGTSPADVQALYDSLNAGAGTGHLAADPNTPLPDNDGIASLPYRIYYPEGFANSRASTFVPIVNPNDQDTRVVVIARYETGTRDQILFDDTIEANTRGGITITTPDLYANDTLLVRKDTPYALEIRSALPVAATMSHYDFTGSTGEAFTSVTSSTWTFPEVSKGQGSFDFIVFQNTSDTTVKVFTTFYRTGGGSPITLSQIIGPKRRGGWNLANEPAIPNGTFGVVVAANAQLVTAVTSFTADSPGGYGALGIVGAGSLAGALPEGQFGINAASESISVLNTNAATADITFVFAFEDAAAYRHTFSVGPQQRASFSVQSLPGFKAGKPYSVSFSSNTTVSVSSPSSAFGDVIGSAFAPTAYSYWGFAEGFRPAGAVVTTVSEFLRIYNPADEDQLLEIRFRFADGSTDTVRALANARRVTDLNLHNFITGARTQSDQFYSVTVKSALPVIAYFGHSDDFFPGAFGLLGTPLGISTPIT